MPVEIALKIFSYLDTHELYHCSLVNKAWSVLTNDPIPKGAFGKKQWMTHFGDIGEEPPLPQNIYKILNDTCPFWPKKKIKDTHLLVLIPRYINNQLFSLKKIENLLRRPRVGYATELYLNSCILDHYGHQSVQSSYWILMTKDVIPGSKKKSYEEQSALIAKVGMGYEVPPTLEANICIFTKYVSSQQRLFSDVPLTYTRCQELLGNAQVVVGGFFPKGFYNSLYYIDSQNIGVAAMRKLI